MPFEQPGWRKNCFVGQINGASEGAVGFFVETGGDGVESVGEEDVELTLNSSIARRALSVVSWANISSVQ